MSQDQSELDAAGLAQRAKGRRTLILLLLVSVAPIVAAYIAFYVWRPTTQASHGTVISPALTMPLQGLSTLDGLSLPAEAKGKWVMVLRAPAACDKDCQQKLYYMRQIRVIQADKMDRVGRLWVFEDAGKPDADLLNQYPGLWVVRDSTLAAALGAAGHIALIDPRGNLMMRFPQVPDSKGVAKDLQKLLKYSR